MDLYEHNGLKNLLLNYCYLEIKLLHIFLFFYMCLLVVHPSINSILCYDPLVMSKFFEIETKFISHLIDFITTKYEFTFVLFYCLCR